MTSRPPKLIVGIDSTEGSVEALRWAADEAARRSWPLHVITCAELPVAAEAGLIGGGALNGTTTEAIVADQSKDADTAAPEDIPAWGGFTPYSAASQYRLSEINSFRALGGAQSYPSRTKDKDDVDFSTGSVGLGVAQTGFASLIQDYVHAKGWSKGWAKGRMVSLMGDAEIDEAVSIMKKVLS